MNSVGLCTNTKYKHSEASLLTVKLNHHFGDKRKKSILDWKGGFKFGFIFVFSPFQSPNGC